MVEGRPFVQDAIIHQGRLQKRHQRGFFKGCQCQRSNIRVRVGGVSPQPRGVAGRGSRCVPTAVIEIDNVLQGRRRSVMKVRSRQRHVPQRRCLECPIHNIPRCRVQGKAGIHLKGATINGNSVFQGAGFCLTREGKRIAEVVQPANAQILARRPHPEVVITQVIRPGLPIGHPHSRDQRADRGRLPRRSRRVRQLRPMVATDATALAVEHVHPRDRLRRHRGRIAHRRRRIVREVAVNRRLIGDQRRFIHLHSKPEEQRKVRLNLRIAFAVHSHRRSRRMQIVEECRPHHRIVISIQTLRPGGRIAPQN